MNNLTVGCVNIIPPFWSGNSPPLPAYNASRNRSNAWRWS